MSESPSKQLCAGCIHFQRRYADWSLCTRNDSKKYRYADDERKSILPWKCGAKGRHRQEQAAAKDTP